jgi:hypothetical protein
MRLSKVVLVTMVFFALACSGLGAGAGGGGSSSSFGTVQHSTWEASSGKYRLVFKGSGNAVYTWRNMTGSAVSGDFTEDGDEVHVAWEPVDYMGSREFKLTRTGKCALAMHWRLDDEGKGVDMSTLYERTVPKCKD